MRTIKRNLSIATLAVIAGVGLSGCGSSSSSKLANTDSTAAVGAQATVYHTGSSSSSTGSGSSSSASNNLLPAASADFAVIGTAANGVTVATGVQTDDHLRIRVTPAAAGTVVIPSGQSTNQAIGYRCAKYSVTVGGVTKTTKILALVPGDTLCDQLLGVQGATAASSEILDFPQFSGHGDLTIKVQQVKTSTYCEWLISGQMGIMPGSPQYYQWLPTYCSSGLYTPYSYTCTSGSNGSAYPGQPNTCGHVTKGTLEIETNGTQFQ